MGEYVKNGNSCIGCECLPDFPNKCHGCNNLKDEVPKRHCQNGRADICLAAASDGVCCPEFTCDIDDGIRT